MIFENCKVPAAKRIGEEGQGFKFAMSGLDGGRINIGACSLGAAWSALDKARQYMFERKAFGRNIADFQALQFKIADMATELEAARLMIYRAADAIDRADPQATMYSAMGKRLATDLGFKVCNEALQIHGGYGYLKDYGLEKLVRDLRVHQILEGTNEIMRVVISRKVLGGNRRLGGQRSNACRRQLVSVTRQNSWRLRPAVSTHFSMAPPSATSWLLATDQPRPVVPKSGSSAMATHLLRKFSTILHMVARRLRRVPEFAAALECLGLGRLAGRVVEGIAHGEALLGHVGGKAHGQRPHRHCPASGRKHCAGQHDQRTEARLPVGICSVASRSPITVICLASRMRPRFGGSATRQRYRQFRLRCGMVGIGLPGRPIARPSPDFPSTSSLARWPRANSSR